MCPHLDPSNEKSAFDQCSSVQDSDVTQRLSCEGVQEVKGRHTPALRPDARCLSPCFLFPRVPCSSPERVKSGSSPVLLKIRLYMWKKQTVNNTTDTILDRVKASVMNFLPEKQELIIYPNTAVTGGHCCPSTPPCKIWYCLDCWLVWSGLSVSPATIPEILNISSYPLVILLQSLVMDYVLCI